jgi:GTPase
MRERCGYVGLVGRPNVGKSTLLNALVGRKLSIVADKPQTTRHRVLGVLTRGAEQLIFVDTPGLHGHEPRQLNRYMNRAAESVFADMDVLVFVVEALAWKPDDDRVVELLRGVDCPVIAVVNKVDRVAEKTRLLPFLSELAGRYPFAEIIPLSARAGSPEHRTRLLGEIARRLPETEQFFFPVDQVTDRPDGFLITELVREQLTRRLGQELPYALTVTLERDSRHKGLRHLQVVIWVERDGQKAIVIGHGGQQLKVVGEQARRAIEAMLGEQVYLNLWVKVRGGWSDDTAVLRRFGYGEH